MYAKPSSPAFAGEDGGTTLHRDASHGIAPVGVTGGRAAEAAHFQSIHRPWTEIVEVDVLRSP